MSIRCLDSDLYMVHKQSCGSNEGSGTWGQLGGCRLLQKIGSTGITCVTDTQGLHIRIGYSHYKCVLMSQSQKTVPVSPVCAAHTFWALIIDI